MSGGMLVVVASAKGAPGVSTACLGLAATWPEDWSPVLVEADRSGGDLAAWHGLAGEPGLLSLAAASRHTGRADLVWDHVQELPGGLHVVPAPAGAEQASAALDVLLGCADLGFLTGPTTRPDHTPDVEDTPDTTGATAADPAHAGPSSAAAPDAAGPGRVAVVADVGRLPAGLTPGAGLGRLLAGADVVLLVAGSDVPGVVHAAATVDALTNLDGRGLAGRVRLLLAGRGGYRAEEVAGALRVPVDGVLPDDPRTAAALAGRPSRGTASVARSPLLRTLAGLAQGLVRDQHAAPGPDPITEPAPDGAGRAGRAGAGRIVSPGGRQLSVPGADLARGGWR